MSSFTFICDCNAVTIKGNLQFWKSWSDGGIITCSVCGFRIPLKQLYTKLESYTGSNFNYNAKWLTNDFVVDVITDQPKPSMYELWTGPEGRKLLHKATELKQIQTTLEKIEAIISGDSNRGKSKSEINVANILSGFPNNNWIQEWTNEDFVSYIKGIGVYLGKRYYVTKTASWPDIKNVASSDINTLRMVIYDVEMFRREPVLL